MNFSQPVLKKNRLALPLRTEKEYMEQKENNLHQRNRRATFIVINNFTGNKTISDAFEEIFNAFRRSIRRWMQKIQIFDMILLLRKINRA